MDKTDIYWLIAITIFMGTLVAFPFIAMFINR